MRDEYSQRRAPGHERLELSYFVVRELQLRAQIPDLGRYGLALLASLALMSVLVLVLGLALALVLVLMPVVARVVGRLWNFVLCEDGTHIETSDRSDKCAAQEQEQNSLVHVHVHVRTHRPAPRGRARAALRCARGCG